MLNKISKLVAVWLLLLAMSAVATGRQNQQSPLSNDEASLALKDPEGREHSLNDHRGKIIVLNFWATWCIPCREEMPILVSLNARYKDRGVQFIAASADDDSTQKHVPRVAQRMKIAFPVWLGATIADMQRLGLGEALPATSIIDRDGRIVGRIIGVVDQADLQNRIDWLLGDRTSPAPPVLINNIEKHEHKHEHAGEEEHEHGGVGVEGASTVPS